MSSKILIKRSTTTGAVPSTSDLDTGELAINTVDKKLYTNNSGTIVEIGVLPSAIDVTNNATVGGTLAVTGNTTLSTGSTSGDFSVAGSLTLSTEGTLDSHVVTKGYVDTAISDVLDSAPAALDTLNELAAAINDDANFAATITTALATKLPLAGGTMTGDIVMGSNSVTSTANPTTDDELARKGYVDTILGSATEAATSASQAATSASNAANSASSASTSETNAAASEGNAASSATAAAASASAAASSASSASSSASAAATSAASASTSASSAESAWDSLDDRYLGAKSSDPTVDNDGDALITGAMYFDSSNNVMKVYSGSEWQNASSSIEGIKSDFVFTATASQVLFSGSDDNTNTLVIDKAGLVNVYLNGVRLTDADYTIDAPGNSVTLGSGATVGDIVEIEVFGNFAGQSGADVAITGGSITGLTELSTGTFTSTGIDDNATSTAITIDASENVGIGITNPSKPLHIQDTTSDGSGGVLLQSYLPVIELDDISGGGTSTIIKHDGTNTIIENGGAERARIDSNGRLGIGSTAPTADLHIKGVNAELDIENNTGRRFRIQSTTANSLSFIDKTANSERARIDSSGNLLIGKTSTNFNTDGFQAFSGGFVHATATQGTANSGTVITVNRKSTDGSIVDLKKDGSTVGSIASYAGSRLSIGSVGANGVIFGSNGLIPATDNVVQDGTEDLGSSSGRWKDLYLSGGVRKQESMVFSSNVTRHDFAFIGNTNPDSSVFGGRAHAHEMFLEGNYSGYDLVFNAKVRSASGGAGTDRETLRIKESGELVANYGVYLGGTGSANKLDDYDEGTWTPVFYASAGAFSSATAVSSYAARYTKVGRLVTCSGSIRLNADCTDAEGTLEVSGLPFTAPSSNYGAGVCHVYQSHGQLQSEIGSVVLVSNTARVKFYKHTSNGAIGDDIYFTFSYEV